MGFYYTEAKKEEKTKPKRPASAAARAKIPIQSLNKMGCDACPRDRDHEDLRSPKMPPSGTDSPLVYLMGSSPSLSEDDSGRHWDSMAGSVIVSKFSKKFRKNSIRSGHLIQCADLKGKDDDDERDRPVDVIELECCRGRVIKDIEQTKPLVVVGVGDQPLTWATSITAGAKTMRGQLVATQIGNHRCWYYSLMWPNFAFRKRKFGKSEYELALEHDIANLERLLGDERIKAPTIYKAPYDTGIELITGKEQGDFQRLERALADLTNVKRSAIDIETNGLRPYIEEPKIWTAAVGTFDRTVAFCLDHPDGWGATSRQRKVWDLFGEYLLYSGKKVAHNLAMELEWLLFFFGERVLRLTDWGDTMAMCHTLDERPGTKSLDHQTRIRFGFWLKDQSRVDVKQTDWINRYSVAETLRYNGLDTKWTDRLATTLEELLEDEDESQRVEAQRKVDLAPTLVLTEAKGLPADIGFAKGLERQYAERQEIVEAKLRRIPEIKQFTTKHGTFSPTNPDHALILLRDIYKRDEVKRTDRVGGVSFSADEDVMNSVPKDEVPAAGLILEHRGIEKLRSTYLAPVISGKVVSFDGRIHCKYSSMTAVTGRLAAADPNVQNWPKRKHREVRGIIYSPIWGWLVACDYGQIEFRVVGMASEDRNLVKYCWTGYDVHGYWAQRMVDEYPEIKDYIVKEFEVDWDEKGLKTLRQESKNGWVFPQLFGSSLKSCADQLHLPEDVAGRLGAEFWDEFAGVKKWQERLIESYERNLYVETLGGRRRRGPMTKNELINHPIQGTAADIVLEGMNALSERAFIDDDPSLQPILNVHDDLTCLLEDSAMSRQIKIITEEMCRHRFDYINVPLVVEVSVGQRWDALEEIAKYRSDVIFGLENPFQSAN